MGSDTFVAQVADLLNHVYDPAYLQRHPAAKLLSPPNESSRQLGQQVRRVLLEAIERLDPGPRIPSRSPNKREHSVLVLRYVEQLTVREVARELGISERQVYRDLTHAVTNLAALLGEESSLLQARQTRDELISQEAYRLLGASELVDVVELIEQVVDAATPLADDRQVLVYVTSSTEETRIATNPLILRQAILASLSHAIQNATATTQIRLSASAEAKVIHVQISYRSEDTAPSMDSLGPIRTLLEQINGHCTAVVGAQRITLRITIDAALTLTVLVIDDNAGLADLFRRYLAHDIYQVIGAVNGAEGLRLAQECPPNAIVLDVMMPGSDGWQVLRQLRSNSSTSSIPVVICSVLDDPQLAYSLGADAFIAKPVTGSKLREVLRDSVGQSVGKSQADS